MCVMYMFIYRKGLEHNNNNNHETVVSSAKMSRESSCELKRVFKRNLFRKKKRITTHLTSTFNLINYLFSHILP